MKIKNLLQTVILSIIVFTLGCKKDKYEEIKSLCPIVVSTNPANGATGVPLAQIVTATFNTKINPATINSSSFTLKSNVNIPGILSYNEANNTLSFDPTDSLKPNTTYTGIITTAVTDFTGNSLQENYIWTFSTGVLITPLVISTDPANNDTGVVLTKAITATFNMPMDAATLTSSTFLVKNGLIPVAGVVTYSGNTATFTPSSPLAFFTLYTCTLTSAIKNTLGTPLSADYIWSFTTIKDIAPSVIITDPANAATGVVLNKTITAGFDMAMDATTINNTTFTIKQGTTSITGVVSYSGTTATFIPTVDLLPGLVYTATITNGVKNTNGTNMLANYVWTFTTVSPVAPVVISTSPTDNETGVALNKVISAVFSIPMDATTINTSTFLVKEGANVVTGVVGYSGTTAAFVPDVDLKPGKVYTVTITNAVKSVLGVNMVSNYVWSFTTINAVPPVVISTSPADNETGVALNKVISAVFSMPMDATTINSVTFLVKEGANVVTGSVGYSGTTAAFVPDVDLLPGKVYTVTITNAVKSAGGTNMVANYVWSFTTEIPVPPTVISTSPANLETDVALNKVISATFSVAMDPATISTSTFTLKLGATTVAGTVNCSGTTATFTPTANLLSDNTYTATITNSVKNLAGTFMVSNYVWKFDTKAHLGPLAPDLKSAGNFGILAGVGISNNAGFSVINDLDVGISPGVRSSVTGFPPAIVVNGAIYCSDDLTPAGVAAMLIQAKQDLTDVYLAAEGASSPAPVTVSGDQGGVTLAPGIYKSTSTLKIENGDLTLDAQGDVNAVWIFQIASGFTTVGGAGGNVILSGGAKASNVYWQVGSSATIGDYTAFKGNVLALTSITMNSYAVANGRMLARNGAVVMTSTNIINKP